MIMRWLRRFSPVWWAVHVTAVAAIFLLGFFLRF
jgi:hypothetical protein